MTHLTWQADPTTVYACSIAANKKNDDRLPTVATGPLMEGYKQHHQDDPELYSLDDLQLDTEAGPHQRFKTLGSGGFGSVYLARLPKRTDTRLTPSGLVTYDKEDLIFLHDMQYGGVVGWDAHVEVLDPAKNETKRYIQVAVKRLTQYSADHLGDLVNEALRLRNLWGSRNVVTVYGVIFLKELECPCIVMERVQGSNLNSFLQRSCKQDLSRERDLRWWKTKIEIFRELVLAVMLCHKQGIYHGDLKGENVLLDDFISPRLVDFGLSFIRRRDKSYYRTFAGSLFWVSPEIYDYSESSPSQELKENPFPSDVYSLGMILVEMFLDGSIPEFVENDFVWDKLLGGVPIPIEPLEDSEDWLKQVVERLAGIAEGCCALREARMTLLQCLEEVEDLYAFVCETFCTAQRDAGEHDFCTTQQYQEMVMRCKTRFPGVQHWVLMQPSKSMLVDGDGNCLIHYFCRLDFVDGVKHIIDRAAWNFQPSRDVVEMSYLSVVEGNISVLRFLGSQWGHILSQELDLVHEACNYDNADILRFLVFDMQMDFSTYYEQELLKPIHKLAKSGRNELIQVLLDAFAHSGRRWRRSDSQDYVNTTVGLGDRYRNDKTPLHYAVQEDQAHTVVFLLEKGGKLAHTNRGLAARACAHGSVQVVRKLTELGYSFDEDSFVDRHPLEYISDNQDEQLLELLKGRIKNLKHIDGWSNYNFPYPPLCSLCRSGNLGMAKTLILEMGANAKFVDREGNTLLHVVAQAKGSIEIAQLLINSGVDLHLENKFGQTALDIAMDNATVDLQSVLQHAGASTGQRAEQKGKEPDLTPNKWVQSPAAQVQDTCKTSHGLSDSLAQAVEEGDIIKVSQILSTRPLKTNCSTNDLLDLLKTCCSKGHLAILQLLHSQGADLYGARTPEDMRSPLHWAVQHRQTDIIRFLIDEGVAVNSQKHSSVSRLVKRNNTEALHHAADLPSEEIMEMLLKAGANANALDRQNYTAMDRAIGFKNKRMVDMLIEHGFDTSERDKENRTYLRLLAETF